MEIMIACLLSLALLFGTVIIHYEVLSVASSFAERLAHGRKSILVMVAAIFVAHLLAVSLYTIVYLLLRAQGSMGDIVGDFDGHIVLDYFYFSIATYTTLGIGDLEPHGPLRLIAGMQALNGFVLLGWSASAAFLFMQKTWDKRSSD
jgi:hypothetical protein